MRLKTMSKQTPKNKAKAASAQNTFRMKVLKVVQGIKKGSVLTYGQVAQKAGHPGAARAVGSLMAQNYLPEVPCHRVVRGDGFIGAYNRGGPQKKIEILKREGVAVSKSGKVM